MAPIIQRPQSSKARPSERSPGYFSQGIKQAARVAFTLGVASFGLLQVQCSEPRSATDIRKPLLQGWGEQIFIKNYAEFEAESLGLHQASVKLCEAPSAETLSAAQIAWRKTRAPLKRNELLNFGPYREEPHRYGPKLDDWPASETNIEKTLYGDRELTSAAFESMGTKSKGLPVVEYLLFRNTEGAALSDIFAAEGRRCNYLTGLTENINLTAGKLRAAWAPDEGNFLAELTEAGKSSRTFSSLDKAFGEIINRLWFTIENVSGEKLNKPVGGRAGVHADPKNVESYYSGNSVEDIRDNLRGIEAVVFGAEVLEPVSLASYLERIGHDELVPRLRAAFDSSYAALDRIPEPLSAAVLDDPELVKAAFTELRKLQALIQTDVINSLGLTLSLNDADGD